jgi:hypothetical protein
MRDERNLARLFLLPGKIRKEIAGRSAITRADALLMQHAVALMILTYAPVRIGNLAPIHVERNLRWSGPNMTGTLVLDIDGAEVKNGQTLSFPLPADCADLVRDYLRSYQPRLVRSPSPYSSRATFPAGRSAPTRSASSSRVSSAAASGSRSIRTSTATSSTSSCSIATRAPTP